MSNVSRLVCRREHRHVHCDVEMLSLWHLWGNAGTTDNMPASYHGAAPMLSGDTCYGLGGPLIKRPPR